MSIRWVARRLGMEHEAGVTRVGRRFKEDPATIGMLKELEERMDRVDPPSAKSLRASQWTNSRSTCPTFGSSG